MKATYFVPFLSELFVEGCRRLSRHSIILFVSAP